MTDREQRGVNPGRDDHVDEQAPDRGDPEEGGEREGAITSPEATIAALRAEVERHKEEAGRNWRQFLHAAADLENYKKQALRSRDEAVERTRRAMLAVILSAVDDIERALQYGQAVQGGEEEAPILEGIRMSHRQVLDLLENLGVRPFEAVGRPFDPRLHEAVEAVPPTERHPVGTVVAELQRGYLIRDEVLRPARVRVAQ